MMKKNAGNRALLAIAALLFLAPIAAAEAGKAPLVVVFDENYPPYSFKDSLGIIQGIIPDLWGEWERRTGRRVELRPMEWEKCLEAIASGEADVIDSIFETEERKRRYDFLDAYATLRVPVFFHQSISGISKPGDLRGFRVAAKRGDACVEMLAGYGIQGIELYPDYESIVLAAKRDEIRVFCIDEPPALYYLYKYGLDSSYKSALNLYTGQFHRAVRKDRKPLPDGSDLLNVLAAGFKAIPAYRSHAIEDRWFGSPLEKRIDPKQISFLGSAVIALLSLFVVFIVVLRRQVAVRTKDLSIKAAALEASERKNRAFIRALPDLFITFDGEGRCIEFLTANPELLARPEGQLVDRRTADVGLDPAIQTLLESSIKRALTAQSVVVCEYELDVIAGKRSFEARLVKMEENRVLAIVRDISARATAERKTAAALKEKEILLKEVHHRVKNNMQVISSLIQLQAGTIKQEEYRLPLQDTQQRIRTMAHIHELLYRSDDLGSIDTADYIGNILEDLEAAFFEYSGSVKIQADIDRMDCDMDTAVPLGLIVNEAVTNSYKYAHSAPQGGRFAVSLKKREDGRWHLTIADNGPGLPDGWESKADSTLGLTLIRVLAAQLDAELRIDGTRGTRIQLVFRQGQQISASTEIEK